MVVKLHSGTLVDVFFNEYNKKSKKRKQIDMIFTDTHRREISRLLDKTDLGDFFHFEDSKKIVSGTFRLLEE
jgi:hypothetical protein